MGFVPFWSRVLVLYVGQGGKILIASNLPLKVIKLKYKLDWVSRQASPRYSSDLKAMSKASDPLDLAQCLIRNKPLICNMRVEWMMWVNYWVRSAIWILIGASYLHMFNIQKTLMAEFHMAHLATSRWTRINWLWISTLILREKKASW